MDVRYFLKERIAFIRRFYDVSASAFVEQKRLIEAGEPPFDDPPYSEDGEPAFLSEWLDADVSVEVVGINCVSLLSDALKLYLNLLQRRELRFSFTEEEVKRLKKQFVATYRDALGEIFDTNWTEAGVDFEIIEQVVLARNRGQHGSHLVSFHIEHDKRTLAKFPRPFFLNAEERAQAGEEGIKYGGFLNPALVVTRETLFAAMDEIEKLADWIDANGERALAWYEARRAARDKPAEEEVA